MIFVNSEENGRFIMDSSIYFGCGVFETIYINEKPVFLKEHVDRINKAKKILDIEKNVDLDEVIQFIQKNNIKNCALKINLTEKNLIFSTRELPYKEQHYKNGFSLTSTNIIKNSTSRLTYIKSTCYIENLIEKKRISRLGFDECVFLNENGVITEGCTCNIFFIKNNKIHTPSIKCGLLDGILRTWIINNFKVVQGEFTLNDLENSEAIFLTNSLMGIIKVSNFNNKQFEDNTILEAIQFSYFKSINGGFNNDR